MSQPVDPPGANPAALLQRTGLTRMLARWRSAWAATTGTATIAAGWRPSRKRAGRRGTSPSTPRQVSPRGPSGWAARHLSSTAAATSGSAPGTVGHSISMRTTTAIRSSNCRRPCGCCSSSRPARGPPITPGYPHTCHRPRRWSGGQVMLAGKITDRLPAQRRASGRHRPSAGHAGSRAGRHHGLGMQQRIDGGAAVLDMTVFLATAGIVAVQVTIISARDAPALEFRNLWRAPHHRRGPGSDHRAERHAVRARSGHRPGAAAGAGMPANHFSTPSTGDGLLLAVSPAASLPSPRLPWCRQSTNGAEGRRARTGYGGLCGIDFDVESIPHNFRMAWKQRFD